MAEGLSDELRLSVLAELWLQEALRLDDARYEQRRARRVGDWTVVEAFGDLPFDPRQSQPLELMPASALSFAGVRNSTAGTDWVPSWCWARREGWSTGTAPPAAGARRPSSR